MCKQLHAVGHFYTTLVVNTVQLSDFRPSGTLLPAPPDAASIATGERALPKALMRMEEIRPNHYFHAHQGSQKDTVLQREPE
jgi:hypothetical protein